MQDGNYIFSPVPWSQVPLAISCPIQILANFLTVEGDEIFLRRL